MRKEKLQRTPQKHKGTLKTTEVNTCQQNRQTTRNGQTLRKVQYPKTEPGRNRKYQQTNQQLLKLKL